MTAAAKPLPKLPPIVGVQETAELLDVAPQTARMWRYRELMPEPDAFVSGQPVWLRARIVDWARETGRAPKGLRR